MEDPTHQTICSTSTNSTAQGSKKDMDSDAISALMTLASTAMESKNEKIAEKAQEYTSNEPEPLGGPLKEDINQNNNSKANISCNRFPAKLMVILNNPDYANILSWSADGEAFMFHDRQAFEAVILPTIFKDSKFDSFLRKLYRWGFAKCQVHSKSGRPAYRHENFLRRSPNDCKQMECRSKPRIQIPYYMNQHQHGGSIFHASMYNQGSGAPSELPFSQHLSMSQQQMSSSGTIGATNEQKCLPDMLAGRKESFKSLSEYISSRRQHHQRIMNSAASLFQSRSITANSNDAMGVDNSILDLRMDHMPIGPRPSYQQPEDRFSPNSSMFPFIHPTQGMDETRIGSSNGGQRVSNQYQTFSKATQLMELDMLYNQRRLSLSRFIDDGHIRQTT